MKCRLLTALIATWLVAGGAWAAEQPVVTVADPYLEMHTGPGKGYPIFHVVDRDETVTVLKRRTDWFKVRTDRGEEGWVNHEQMERTLEPDGEFADYPEATMAEYSDRRWELGLMAGDFGGANVVSGFGALGMSRHLSLELWVSQLLGDFSDGWMVSGNLVHTFVPKWRVSPFFSLGTGIIHVQPKAALAQVEDRTDQVGIVGLGVRAYLTERFVLRAEYKDYVVFTSRDENEEIDEWKAGFAVFF